MPTNSRRKSDAARRANQVIRSRTMLVMVLLGVCTFLLLFWKLYDLQINRHEELQGRAVNQQTLSAVVTASRGTIYDRSGYIMAASATAETGRLLWISRRLAASMRRWAMSQDRVCPPDSSLARAHSLVRPMWSCRES